MLASFWTTTSSGTQLLLEGLRCGAAIERKGRVIGKRMCRE